MLYIFSTRHIPVTAQDKMMRFHENVSRVSENKTIAHRIVSYRILYHMHTILQ